MAYLARRGVSSPDMCPRCQRSPETMDRPQTSLRSGIQSIILANPRTVLPSIIHGWRSSEGAAWKINYDATTDYARRVIGQGINIRDKSCKVFSADALKVKAMYSPIIAEAMAVWWGIGLALDFGLVPFQIESDCLQVVEMVSKGSAEVGHIISMIVASLGLNPGCSISHTPSTGNLVAHHLAKIALLVDHDCFWLDSCPPCMERLVQIDAFG
ncbi:hypothetical protein QYF36_016970 [Acer negundo]|nr:hypothetical protein QYF36_016970 [Acer negundo]